MASKEHDALMALVDSFNYYGLGGLFPRVVSIIGLCLLVPLLISMFRKRSAHAILFDSENEQGAEPEHGIFYFVAWILGFLGCCALVGFPIGLHIALEHPDREERQRNQPAKCHEQQHTGYGKGALQNSSIVLSCQIRRLL